MTSATNDRPYPVHSPILFLPSLLPDFSRKPFRSDRLVPLPFLFIIHSLSNTFPFCPFSFHHTFSFCLLFYLRLFFRFAHSSPCLPSPQLLFLDLSLFFSIRVTFPFCPFSAPSFCVRNFILLHQLNIADPPPLLIPEPPTSRPARSRREKNRINIRLSQDPPK